MIGRRYCVYLLRCNDGSLYCGIAMDLNRRIREHQEGKGARYTAAHLPVELEFATGNRFERAEAQAVERRVKKLRKKEKKKFLESLELSRQGRKPEGTRSEEESVPRKGKKLERGFFQDFERIV